MNFNTTLMIAVAGAVLVSTASYAAESRMADYKPDAERVQKAAPVLTPVSNLRLPSRVPTHANDYSAEFNAVDLNAIVPAAGDAPPVVPVVEAVEKKVKAAVAPHVQKIAAPVQKAVAPAPVHHQKTSAHWGYHGGEDAMHWGDLDTAYHACKGGHAQSPINIAVFAQKNLPALEVSYLPTSLQVVNNGHTIQANYTPGSSLNVGGASYGLKQIHFHTPSEHYIDGAPYPMEAHFVHQAADGTLVFVGVMIKVGAKNPIIEGIWANAPMKKGVKTIESVQFNGADLLPVSKAYFAYGGSLTTPPCSEGVKWYVLKEPITLSAGQLQIFQTLFPLNARPIQPLEGRIIQGN